MKKHGTFVYVFLFSFSVALLWWMWVSPVKQPIRGTIFPPNVTVETKTGYYSNLSSNDPIGIYDGVFDLLGDSSPAYWSLSGFFIKDTPDAVLWKVTAIDSYRVIYAPYDSQHRLLVDRIIGVEFPSGFFNSIRKLSFDKQTGYMSVSFGKDIITLFPISLLLGMLIIALAIMIHSGEKKKKKEKK